MQLLPMRQLAPAAGPRGACTRSAANSSSRCVVWTLQPCGQRRRASVACAAGGILRSEEAPKQQQQQQPQAPAAPGSAKRSSGSGSGGKPGPPEDPEQQQPPGPSLPPQLRQLLALLTEFGGKVGVVALTGR
jgi:hypothetical protein